MVECMSALTNLSLSDNRGLHAEKKEDTQRDGDCRMENNICKNLTKSLLSLSDVFVGRGSYLNDIFLLPLNALFSISQSSDLCCTNVRL